MKRNTAGLPLTLLLMLGMSHSNALAVNAVDYLGKTTWTGAIGDSTDAEDIGETFTVTGGISKVGDEFYLFQGYVIPGTDGPFVMSGSGFMTEDTLEFTLSESQNHTSSSWRDSGIMHVSIDKTTLNGTFYDIGQDFNTSTRQFDQRYSAGTLTRSGPAIPLSKNLAPLQLLLNE